MNSKYTSLNKVIDSAKLLSTTDKIKLIKNISGQIEQELKKLSAKIEPAALIIMGTVVALIVSAVILPIFKLSQALH